ncbi:MAG: glycosyltransferase [Bacteroidetes bacterium]|nr:glycosyltransferase [Bacteroidota bacterium]
MNHKKKILIFVDWYLPGYKAGGPIRSIANMYSHLKNDYDFRIVTSDLDLHEEIPYPLVKSDQWTKGPDGSDVLYLSKAKRNYNEIAKILKEERADFIYLNSVFSKVFTVYPLLARKRHFPVRKVILAPRGMLGAGALQIKAAKKKIFLSWMKITGLCSTIRWHASSEGESAEVKKIFGKNASTKIALNLSEGREINPIKKIKKKGEMKIAFLSRISIKKNLEGTLHLLSKTSEQYKIQFDIFGPIEDANYWSKCEVLIRSMPKHVKVNYKGAIANNQVTETLKKYHFSILLTFNENFGHSIIESMAAGCPVIISDQTPWRDLEKKLAGWDLTLKDEDKILQVLNDAAEMDEETFDIWNQSAQKFAMQIIFHPQSIQQHKELFS